MGDSTDSPEVSVVDYRIRYEALLSSLECLVLMVDGDRQVTSWNPAIEKSTGLSSDDVLGRPLEEVPFSWSADLVEALTGLKSHDERIQDHEIELWEEGIRTVIGVSAYPVIDPEASIEGAYTGGWMILARDITEKKRAGESLERSARLQSIGELAAGIVHEINTPTQYAENNLSYVQDVLEEIVSVVSPLVSGQVHSLEEVRECLRELDFQSVAEELRLAVVDARCGITEISRIVDGVRQFTHPGGSSEISPEDINEVIQSAVKLCEPRWKSRARVECSLAEDLPSVPCHAGGIRQVIVNLVSNAIDAFDVGLTNGCIAVRTSLMEGRVCIEVEDNASGMSATVVRQIFDPFFTTKAVGQGTGQGLTLVHSIIEEHSGRIEVTSSTGVGSCFRIELPLDGQLKQAS